MMVRNNQIPRVAALIPTLFCLFALATAGIDGDAGSNGFSFLKVSPDATTAALANSSVASSGRQPIAVLNPAGLARLNHLVVTATHTRWFSTITQNYLGTAWKQWDGTAAISLRTQSSGDIPLRGADLGTAFGAVPTPEPSGTYGVYDAALTISYGFAWQGFDWGAGLSYIYEKIYTSQATAIAVDLGIQWHEGPWANGFAVRNLGRSGEMQSERVSLPWDARLGGSYSRAIGDIGMTALTEIRYTPDYVETVHFGIETSPVKPLTLRAGYHVGLNGATSDDGWSAGIGLRWHGMAVNYAFLPEIEEFGGRHLFTLSSGGSY
jgi:hypothetical protein